MKYGQRDSANEILRTEVLTRLSSRDANAASSLYIVTHPEALSELVVSQKHLDERRITLKRGQRVDIIDVEHKMRGFGFTQEDYVYEPGQFAVRGSILDVYSYSCELPYRIDFFDDEIDSIRTFEVEDQLSKDLCQEIVIVPELAQIKSDKIPFLSLLEKIPLSLPMTSTSFARPLVTPMRKDSPRRPSPTAWRVQRRWNSRPSRTS